MAKAVPLSPLAPFLLDDISNIAQRWTVWKEAFEYFVKGSGITDDGQKKAVLLHQAGIDVQRTFRTLTVAENTYAAAVTALDEYFNPKRNVAYERHVFRQAYQGQQESMDAYVARLRNLIRTCEYRDDELNVHLRDQIVEKCVS